MLELLLFLGYFICRKTFTHSNSRRFLFCIYRFNDALFLVQHSTKTLYDECFFIWINESLNIFVFCNWNAYWLDPELHSGISIPLL